MTNLTSTNLPLWILGAVLLALSLRVYGRLLAQLVTGSGQVRTEPYSLADLLVVTVLGTWLGGLSLKGLMNPAPQKAVDIQMLLESVVMFALLVGLIIFLLNQRRVSLRELFGFTRLSGLKSLGNAGLFLLAAYPIVAAGQYLTHLWFNELPEAQEIVQFFTESAENGLYLNMAVTMATGIIVAPLAEEFIFRGYIYGVLRRNLGIIPSILVTSLLFASIHLNLSALPALFLLGICLTLAYENTGSLVVPMLMHAGFNFLTFAALFISTKLP